jgi:RecA-family ATPase
LGGDPSRFFLLNGTIFTADGEQQRGSISLTDIPILEKAIIKTKARLLVVDPIQSYMGASVDLHRSNETRPVLDGLSKLAAKYDCAILLVRHLSKAGNSKAITRGLGSIDLSGAVRSEMLAGSLPDDPETRALIHVKSNIGKIGETLGYRIDNDGQFSWTGKSQVTAFDLLAAPEGPDRGAVERAQEWLTALLKTGSKDYRTILELAGGEGFKEKTLRRAKTQLRIQSRKASFGGGWIWWLPENEPGSEAANNAQTR